MLTGASHISARVTVEAVTVEGSMGSLNVTVMELVNGTFICVFAGYLSTIVGLVKSDLESVMKVHW
jgi:hypothetical protein